MQSQLKKASLPAWRRGSKSRCAAGCSRFSQLSVAAAARGKRPRRAGGSRTPRWWRSDSVAPFILPRFKLKYKICIQSPQDLAQ